MDNRSRYGIEDLVQALVEHLGLDRTSALTQQLGYGEYFHEPPEDEEPGQAWFKERYARDLYGHLVATDVAAFFQQNLQDVREAQVFALRVIGEDTDELLSEIDKALSAAEVLSLLQPRLCTVRELTFGIEDCIRRIRERVDGLPYVKDYGEDILSDLFRGRVIGLWSEVEALLKLLLIFYEEYFAERDAITKETFEQALRRKSLGPLFSSIQEVERCFRKGEPSWHRSAREKELQTRIEELESSLRRMERDHNDSRERLSRAIRQKDIEISEVAGKIGKIAFQLSDTRNEGLQSRLRAELGRLENRRKALEHQRTQHQKEEDRLNMEEAEEQSRIRGEIARAQAQFNKDTLTRQDMAAKLQARCQRLLGRTTPFEGMDLDGIKRLVSPHRNPPAHLVQELLMKQGAIQEAQEAGEKILGILSQWLTEGMFPRTAQVLGRWQDMYGRTLLVLAVDDPSDNPEPLWSLKRLIWLYEWKTRPWSDNEVCLVAARPGQMVFEPIIFSWTDIRPTLMSLFNQDDSDEEQT